MKPIPPSDKQVMLETSATLELCDSDSRMRLLQMLYELGRHRGMEEGLERAGEIMRAA